MYGSTPSTKFGRWTLRLWPPPGTLTTGVVITTPFDTTGLVVMTPVVLFRYRINEFLTISTSIGSPVRALKRVPNCHPPSSPLASALALDPYLLPLPYGSSYSRLRLKL